MILVDTTPLVALCDDRDSRHGLAEAQLRKLASAKFCTCEPVLMESCFLLRHAYERERLKEVLDGVAISSILGTCDRHFWSDVLDWLAKYAEHKPDWADACIAVLCGRDTTLRVWTYDQEFRTIWRRPDGSAIPLAIRA